jgi:hypothetical protein
MKLLIDVPDALSPEKYNCNSVADRASLAAAFKKAQPVVEVTNPFAAFIKKTPMWVMEKRK